jgi:peptidoglycan/LPS O-acetylase OafA/YrhL
VTPGPSTIQHRVAGPAARAAGAGSARRAGHRTDIQGLRAVAVLLVVLGHAGVPMFAGGYVGVDVFFVISGFLITGLLVREYRATGRISLRRFYARRVARLLPAATLVVAATLGGAWLWLAPARLAGYGLDAVATAGYAINVRLAAVAADYFGDPAPSPFRHFWSLAVEEQFYLVWPLLILLVRGRILVATLAVLCVGSFGWSAYQLTQSAPWAYYGLPSRAWELGAGALLACAAGRLARLPRWSVPLLGWAGLAVIVGSAVGYDAATAFPGVAALAPVLGAAAVIAAGCAAPGGAAVLRADRPLDAVPPPSIGAVPPSPACAVPLLGAGPLQVVGRLSYSWYLWHWPVLVMVPMAAGRELGLAARLALCGVALALAAVTYHCLEDPVRRRRVWTLRPGRGLALGLGLSAMTSVVAVLVMVVPPAVPVGPPAVGTGATLGAAGDAQAELARMLAAADGVRRVPANLKPAVADARNDRVRPQDDGCHLSLGSGVRQPVCTYGPATATRTVVLLGDSHALQWFPAVEDLAARNGWRLVSLTRSSCTPAPVAVVNAKLHRRYVECDAWRSGALSRIDRLRPDLVLVTSKTNYPGMLAGRPADPDRLWREAWARLFAALRADAGRVVLLSDTPTLSRDPLDCLTTRDVADCAEPPGIVLRDPDWRAGAESVARRAGVAVVDPTPWLCARRCPLIVGDLLVYRDNNHLTSAYAASLSPLLRRALGRLP